MKDKKKNDSPTPAKPVVDLPQTQEIKITQENFGPAVVHYLQLIYGRMGYLIKLLEAQANLPKEGK